MSVYQVEEYYIYLSVDDEKSEDVKDFIDNCDDLIGLEVRFDGGELFIEGFGCEPSAYDILEQINNLL